MSSGKRRRTKSGAEVTVAVRQPPRRPVKAMQTSNEDRVFGRRMLKAFRGNIRPGGFLGLTLKFRDYEKANGAITDTTAMVNAIQDPTVNGGIGPTDEGASESQRQGRQITAKSVFVTGAIEVGSTNTAIGLGPVKSAQKFFVALVLDKHTNNALWTDVNAAQVFKNPSLDVACQTSLLRNLEFTDRYKVLDHMIVEETVNLAVNNVGAATQQITAAQILPFKLSWKGHMPINYSATASPPTSQQIVDNTFHVIVTHARQADGGENPTAGCHYNARMRFLG
nr:capsid protein [Cressdnaviricota sp.]UOF82983.1 capsid protein [Cressdnaviricota sp.]